MSQDPFRRPPTAQEAVLGELRRALVGGDLRPGQQIRQDTLAHQLGVSRVPLREALKILEGEGAVTYLPHRGYFVADLSARDLEEVYLIRSLLEDEAVRGSLPAMGAQDLAAFESAVRDCEQAGVAGDVQEMAAANRRLHFILYQAGGRPRLVRMIRILWDATDAYRSLYYATETNRERVNSEHAELTEAVRARDVEWALRLLAAHRQHAVDNIRTVLAT